MNMCGDKSNNQKQDAKMKTNRELIKELRDPFLMDKTLPSTGRRKKTNYEMARDACIPEAVDEANTKFKTWWSKNQTANKDEKQVKMTQ